jgi:predicted membrane protein
MTNITFEENGFTLEQKFRSKNFKTFICFDNVSNKTGYYNSKNYYNFVFVIMFLIILFFEILNHGFRIISSFYAVIIVYFLYDFIKNLQKFKTLSLTNSKDIYFTKDEYKYIDEILDKRNIYFYEKYFNKIDTYNDEDKIQTINWLYKEDVVNKFEILKIDGIKYNEENDKFYLKQEM